MLFRILSGLVLVANLVACSTGVSSSSTMPNHIKLADSFQRTIDKNAGATQQETATKCAYNMLNGAGASIEAKDIQYRINDADGLLVIEVDALLLDVGAFRTTLPITYRCEYKDKLMIRGTWVRR